MLPLVIGHIIMSMTRQMVLKSSHHSLLDIVLLYEITKSVKMCVQKIVKTIRSQVMMFVGANEVFHYGQASVGSFYAEYSLCRLIPLFFCKPNKFQTYHLFLEEHFILR